MKVRAWWEWPALVLLLFATIAFLPFILIAAVGWFSVTSVLLLIVWARWLPRRTDTLVVYSNSPIWQAYFEGQVIPRLGDRAVLLNWSERRQWRWSLPVLLFRCLAPRREFNPIVMVFRPFRWPLIFRFYEAFRAFMHGRPEQVEQTRRDLFRALGLPD